MASAQEIVVVDDETDILALQEATLSVAGLNARTFSNPLEAWEYIRQNRPRLVISDWEMPGLSGMDLLFKTRGLPVTPYVIILTGFGSVDRAVQALKMGAFSFLEKPFDPEKYLELVQSALDMVPPGAGDLRKTRAYATSTTGDDPKEPIVRSPKMKRVLEMVRAAAPTDSNVLLLGESGTGKEVVADYLHACSARSRGPLVKVNCGALPEHLMESELFGHEKGAFTGADRRRVGRFELAHNGTLFLDEIGDLPLPLQVKLLRALQEHVIERVGSSASVPTDFRLVSATHKDLAGGVGEGTFREDLYYRINVVPIRLPALRDRPEDVEPLAQYFFSELTQKLPRKPQSISQEALDCLRAFAWPGNVRQLRNAIEYALVMCLGDAIGAEHLPEELRTERSLCAPAVDASAGHQAAVGANPSLPVAEGGLQDTLKNVESDLIRQALDRHQWNVTEVVRELKLSRSALYERMKQYGIKRPDA
ncbi:MAG: sigma-54-dependent Fis family transcriptional regulator [Planctomycetes bacterium]|nr:sigma-54-dependent Fis family transcriptional regulator [Planctomycetota bacterium]